MHVDRTRVTTLGALCALVAVTACDTGPTEPPLDTASMAAAFNALQPAGEPGEGPIQTACPAGGTFTFELSESVEQDDGITIRHTQWVRRYQDCGMQRGSAVITANGELTWTGETHLKHEDAEWPHGVLLQKGRQVGTITMMHDGAELQSCEYDLEMVYEPAAGRYSRKGTVCGYTVNREIHIPL